MGEPLSIVTSVGTLLSVCLRLSQAVNSLHYRFRRSTLTISALSSECITTSTALAHLQSLLHERPEAFASAANTRIQLRSCFDNTIVIIASTLSILDEELDKLNAGNPENAGTVSMKFSFLNRTKFTWNENVFKEISGQIRDQRSSISFLINCMQFERIADVQHQMQQHSSELAEMRKTAADARSLHSARISRQANRKTKVRATDLDSILSQESLDSPTVSFQDDLLASGPYQKAEISDLQAKERQNVGEVGKSGSLDDSNIPFGKAQHNLAPNTDIQPRIGLPVSPSTRPHEQSNDARKHKSRIPEKSEAGSDQQVRKAPHRKKLPRPDSIKEQADVDSKLKSPPRKFSSSPEPPSPRTLPKASSYNESSVPEPDSLHEAIASNDYEAVFDLLESGANPNGLSSKEIVLSDNRTPWTYDKVPALVHAAALGRERIVSLLLKNEADIEARDSWSRTTALMAAARHGEVDVASTLLSHGASTTAMDSIGDTPLNLASSHKHLDVVKLLVEHGADIDLVGGSSAWPALARAAGSGSKDIVEYLIKSGANVNQVSSVDQTALHLAAYHGHIAIAEVLLDHDARTDIGDYFHWTALHCAARCPNGPQKKALILKFFIGKGLAHSRPDEYGYSAMHYCICDGFPEGAQLLIDAGVDVNTTTKEGITPIRTAIEKGYSDVVEKLVQRGAVMLSLTARDRARMLFLNR